MGGTSQGKQLPQQGNVFSNAIAGVGNWVKQNPAQFQGLITAGLGAGAGMDNLTALGLGGQAYGQVKSDIAAQRAAELKNRMDLMELGVKQTSARTDAYKAEADILKSKADISLAKSANAQKLYSDANAEAIAQLGKGAKPEDIQALTAAKVAEKTGQGTAKIDPKYFLWMRTGQNISQVPYQNKSSFANNGAGGSY